MNIHRITILALVACLALTGCKKKEEAPAPAPAPEVSVAPPVVETTPAEVPFRVTTVDLGKAVGADKKISEPATTFGPKDTIYASVATEGAAPSAVLKARWTFGDAAQLVKEEEITITPTGPANSEFHISKASGWPAGKYKVEILADGASAATKDFEVQK
ncbi:MAG: hypothetical protein ACJ75H_18200 [Thermoanaerobaculia bacterium]